MNKKKIVVGLMIVVFSCALVGNSFAFGGMKGKHYDLKKKLSKKIKCILQMEEKLELNEKQVNKIKALELEAKKEIIRAEAEIEILGLDIKTKLHEDKINVKEVNKLIDEKYEFKKKKAKTLVNGIAKLKAVLTKEQTQKLKEYWKECKKQKKSGMADCKPGSRMWDSGYGQMMKDKMCPPLNAGK
ncbi:MAG: hypothetical protein GY853_11985 [PVC group bacterium]|nr:hypothetical protein [PVC group bacterium]